MQKITPCLWFDNEAEEAVNFYTSVFKNSSIESIKRFGKEGPGPEGSIMEIMFNLDGQKFLALNESPPFTFTPAISFLVNCETQEEIDELWDKLSEGGEIQQCGWLTDKFGVTWQIIPAILFEMLEDKDPERSGRVMRAMLQMVKIDINKLKQAYENQ